jgi:CRP-like cAMP-binding protein
MNDKELLKLHVAKVVKLTDEEFDYFFSHLKPQACTKKQSLISPGDTVTCEYFVTSGCLKTFHIGNESKIFILQFAMTNWWASDYNALYMGGKATVGIDCITDSSVLCLTFKDLEKLCSEIRALEYFFRWRSNKGYVALQKRLLSYVNKDVKQRYEELIKQYPLLYQMVPKHLIAAYLGVSRETLSRLYGSANR